MRRADPPRRRRHWRRPLSWTERVALGVLAAVVAVVLAPWVLSIHDPPRPRVCDNEYVRLNGQLTNELDSVLHGLTTACGTFGGPEEVIQCAITTNSDYVNPRNFAEPVFTHVSEVATAASSCRVGLEPVGTNGIRVIQWRRLDSESSRTFSVVVE